VTTIALFGGSFNPPHVAHQMVCLWVVETCAVDALWMMPTHRHPFGKPLAPFADRVAMCELAAAPLGRRVLVSTVERDLGFAANRTVETLEELTRRHPETSFRLVVGADVLCERGKWHRWADVVGLAPPIVLGRAGYPSDEAAVVLPDVSSTEVRTRLARGESAVPLVSCQVMDYIAARGLYR
jgi:nicotinate-nucleotide adenylyltransferase